jgi:hypothetical protein
MLGAGAARNQSSYTPFTFTQNRETQNQAEQRVLSSDTLLLKQSTAVRGFNKQRKLSGKSEARVDAEGRRKARRAKVPRR